MKNQLYLFHGENTFALSEELRRWKQEFLKKHGEANFQRFDGKMLKWITLVDEIQTPPFLGEKRLVLVEGMPTIIEKEELALLSSVIHPSTILAIVDPAPDKRKNITKFLLKEATVKTFLPMTPKQLIAWLQQLARENGADIETSVAAHLIAQVGTDQWHLKNELLKLLAFIAQPTKPDNPTPDALPVPSEAEGRPTPTISDINLISIPSEKHTVWKMSDLIGKGDIPGAIRFARTLEESGEDAFSLWNIFLWIIRNMATLWIWQNEKNLPIGMLCKNSGIPFQSVQSLLPFVQKFSESSMRSLVASVIAADEDLKTGKLKATGGEPIELEAMLERQMMRMKTL